MDPWDSFGFHFLALSGWRSEQKKHNNFFGFDDLLTIVNNYITDQPSICGSQHKIKKYPRVGETSKKIIVDHNTEIAFWSNYDLFYHVRTT